MSKKLGIAELPYATQRLLSHIFILMQCKDLGGRNKDAEYVLGRVLMWFLSWFVSVVSMVTSCVCVGLLLLGYQQGDFSGSLYSWQGAVLLISICISLPFTIRLIRYSRPAKSDVFIVCKWLPWRIALWWTGLSKEVEKVFLLPDHMSRVRIDLNHRLLEDVMGPKNYLGDDKFRFSIEQAMIGQLEFFSRMVLQSEASIGFLGVNAILKRYYRLKFVTVYTFAKACECELSRYGRFFLRN